MKLITKLYLVSVSAFAAYHAGRYAKKSIKKVIKTYHDIQMIKEFEKFDRQYAYIKGWIDGIDFTHKTATKSKKTTKKLNSEKVEP